MVETLQEVISANERKSPMDNSGQKAFVVFNPMAGKEDEPTELRSALARHFTLPRWTVEIYETTGKEDITAICRSACEQGTSLVISAGGDGTVVSVANALVHRQIPLGILPLGTGNFLARILSIPLKLDDAVQLLAGDHTIIDVDALKVGDGYFFSNVSVGMSPEIMNDTKSAQKKRFGRLAYFFTVVKRSSLFRRRGYTLTIDGQTRQVRASEVLVSNTSLLDKESFIYGPPETLNDGQLEIYLTTAQSLADYVRLVWDMFRGPGHPGAKLYHWESRQSIRIDADRSPQLVQADGEVIGHTPVEIQLVPKAIHVIMPKPADV
jgi:diacylglycerol kinase (ATP)